MLTAREVILQLLATVVVTSTRFREPPPSPIVTQWHSAPVSPNRTILVTFLQVQPGTTLAPRLCANSTPQHMSGCMVPELGNTSATSLSIIVPADWSAGEYCFQLCAPCPCVPVNRADPLFAVLEVSWAPRLPSLRVVGRALAFDAAGECIRANSSLGDRQQSSTRVRLRPATSENVFDNAIVKVVNVEPSTTPTELIARSATCYDLHFDVPSALVPGDYYVEVHNGLQSEWSVLDQRVRYQVLAPMMIQHRPTDLATLRSALTVGGAIDLSPTTLIHLGANDTLSIGMMGHTILNCSTCVPGGPKPVLRWDAIDPKLPEPLVTLHNSSAIVCLILLRVECANPTPVISIADGSTGILVESVEMRSQLSFNFTSNVEVNNALYVGAATNFIIRHCVLEEDPARPGGPGLNGSAQNPQPVPCYNTGQANFVFFLASSSDGVFENNTIKMGCNGWFGESARRIILVENTFRATGFNVSEGSGFNTLGTGLPSTTDNALLRNLDVGNPLAYSDRDESFTSDGGIGAYYGPVVGELASRNVKLATVLAKHAPNAARTVTNWSTAGFNVVSGPGAGLLMQVSSSNGKDVLLAGALPIALNNDDVATIIPWEGRTVIAGNTYINGSSIGFFGAAMEVVIADNSLFDMVRSYAISPGGINFQSLHYGSGYQPSVYVSVERNDIRRSAGVQFVALENFFYGGSAALSRHGCNMTLSRGMVARGNTVSDVILNGSSIGQPTRQHTNDYVSGVSVVGRMEGVLVEDNWIQNGQLYVNASHFCTLHSGPTSAVDCTGCSIQGITIRANDVAGHFLPLTPNGTVPQPVPGPNPPKPAPAPPPPTQLGPAMYNVVWKTPSVEPGVAIGVGPSKSSILTVNGSMPIGNGDLTASAYPDVQRGSILLWFGKQDAVSDSSMPFKLGQLELAVFPNPWCGNSSFFRQTLDLTSATVTILAGGSSETDYKIRFETFIDINNAVAHIIATAGPAGNTFSATVTLTSLHPVSEPWGISDIRRCGGAPQPYPPDVMLSAAVTGPNTIGIYHRNAATSTLLLNTLREQALTSLVDSPADPRVHGVQLANRTFGLAVGGNGFVRVPGLDSANATVLRSTGQSTAWHVAAVAYTSTELTVSGWVAQILELLARNRGDGVWQPTGSARLATSTYWRAFWERSWIRLLNPAQDYAAHVRLPSESLPIHLPSCESYYCVKKLAVQAHSKLSICSGINPLGQRCAAVPRAMCSGRNLGQCIKAAAASCNVTGGCMSVGINPDWPGCTQYFSDEVAVTNPVWTLVYRNPGLGPLPPSPPPSPPSPPSPSPPVPSAAAMFGVSQRYALTRYTSAVQSRRLAGFSLPIKFNGMSFTMQRPWSERTHSVNESKCHSHALGCVEYREWGPYDYWQNNRLSYWPMIIAGDFDTLRPVFEYFLQMLPFAEARTRSYFQHAGVFWSETKTIFGSFGIDDYGCDHTGVPRQLLQSTYMRYDYAGNGGGTEVSLMILDSFLWSKNATDLRRYWPIVTKSLNFFIAHYPIRRGKVQIFPSQALETFQCPLEAGMNESWQNGAWTGGLNVSNCVLNDAPTVAALHSLLEKVLALPSSFGTHDERASWRNYLSALPPLPQVGGVLQPYENTATYPLKASNSETPQLYSVHPYRLMSVGRAHRNDSAGAAVNLTPALKASTMGQPGWGQNDGWAQDIMNNALLGRAAEAAQQVLERSAKSSAPGYRFPGFAFGGGLNAHPPAVEQLNNMNSALNLMLIQPKDDGFSVGSAVLFPAWPCEWDVDAKLAGPLNSSVYILWVGGKLLHYEVEPPSRTSAFEFVRCV